MLSLMVWIDLQIVRTNCNNVQIGLIVLLMRDVSNAKYTHALIKIKTVYQPLKDHKWPNLTTRIFYAKPAFLHDCKLAQGDKKDIGPLIFTIFPFLCCMFLKLKLLIL